MKHGCKYFCAVFITAEPRRLG